MRREIIALLLLAALATEAGTASAGTGSQIVLPTLRQKPRSGLRLTIDTQWVSGSGYRPVVVRIAPLLGGPAPAERFVDVMIRPRGWYPGSRAAAAMATVQLEQGANYGEVTIDVPQSNAWNAMDIEAYEGGKYLSDLEAVRAPLGGRFYFESMDSTPSILILHRLAPNSAATGLLPTTTPYSIVVTPTMTPNIAPSTATIAGVPAMVPLLAPKIAPNGQPGMGKELNLLPDLRVLAGRFEMSYYNGYVTADRLLAKTPTTDSETMRLVSDLPFLGLCSRQTFPDHWLSLSGVDVIIASLEDLRLLAAQSPEKLEAIRTWLSTGTMLCVYGVGADYARLPDLESLLEFPQGQGAAEALKQWTPPHKTNYKEDIEVLADMNGGQNWWVQQANIQRKALDGDATSKMVAASPPIETPFVQRALGQGAVVAMAAENPFPGTEREWAWLFNSVSANKWLWYKRHGISFQNKNQQFWNFLIADIGRAPVLSFLALITLFAVVIGPVNYYVLHRRGRLYLLLVTVPLGALVVTFALFLYATLGDGLGTRARVRSFTQIEQNTGRAVSWSRQMYYAGLAPSRGFVFPASAAIYPIDYEPINGIGMQDASRKTVWGEDQNLVSGYFISRTPSQLMTVEPQRTEARLAIDPASDPPQATNRLGATAQRILVCDQQGRYWSATNLANGATATLKKTSIEEERAYWMRVHGETRLRFPDGFNPANMENISGFFSSGLRFGNSPPPTVDSSVLESAISDCLALKTMQPNSYIVLADRPPFVSLGVESAQEKLGLHLVVGTW